MDLKTFGYLYYKTRGFDKEDILAKAEITEDEYDFFELNLSLYLAEIEEEHPKAENIGNDFVRLTRYVYDRISDQESGVTRPDAILAKAGEMVSLPAVGTISMPSLGISEIIGQRRSVRKYSDEEISPAELSYLLWATSWARDFRSNEKIELTLRNVPSAGARHPFETYLMITRVKGIKPGLYYYHPIKHCLVLQNDDPKIKERIFEACFRQEMVNLAAVTFIWTAIPYRTAWRYGQRGYRYLYLDAGHVGQNLHLASEAIGCGTCMIGAYLDEMMNDCLDCDGSDEFVIYVAPVGKKPASESN